MRTGTAAASPSGSEVWLRGNIRPVLGLAVVGGLAVAGMWACALLAGASSGWRWLAAAVSIMIVALVATLAVAAARPRLVRRGERLVVRVSPLAVEPVPLDVVECFFPGSNPLDASGEPTCGEHARFRVGTLVMRIAERAVGHQRRETFSPWCIWKDGYVVIDGRWCEPLSPALTRDLAGRLAAAKREGTPAGGAA